MRFPPQGLERIRIWKQRIGRSRWSPSGITLERAPDVYARRADSIAVVTDVAGAADPVARAREWLALEPAGE